MTDIRPVKNQNFTRKKQSGWETPSHKTESDQIKKTRRNQQTEPTEKHQNT